MLRNILIVGIISLSLAFTTVSSNDEKLTSQLFDGIQPIGFNASVDDAKKLLEEKCQKVSGSDEAFQKAETASEVFRDCLTGLVDFEVLQNEIDRAKPSGDLDVVFNKYCRKRPIAIECINVFSVAIEPCLDEGELAGKTNLIRIFTNLLNFVCQKDGDYIALFIAEKGPECFNDKHGALIACLNTIMSGYIPSEIPTVDKLPQFAMGVQQCNDMNTLQHCMVRELEACEESTPANLVDAMFKYVRNESPCANMNRG